jgi:uncharacterized protein
MDLSIIFALLVLGSITGFLAGLLGIGGGMLLVPFTTALLTAKGVPLELVLKIALATSLATIVFTSISSVRAHHRRGAVQWRIFSLLTPGILIGSFVGAQIASRMKASWLGVFFALFLVFLATQLFLDRKPKPGRQLPGRIGGVAAGSGIGLIASLVGAGGGFASVPFMLWCNVSIQHAVATSAALGLPIAVFGSLGYLLAPSSPQVPLGTIGYVYFPAVAAIGFASVITAPIGARTAHKLPTATLKKAFAMLIYALAVYMVIKVFSSHTGAT